MSGDCYNKDINLRCINCDHLSKKSTKFFECDAKDCLLFEYQARTLFCDYFKPNTELEKAAEKVIEKSDEFFDNQEVKKDAGKLRLTLVPRGIIEAIAKVRMFGVKKYKNPDNWKKVEKARYRDAAFRHFIAYLDDPKSIDEESGITHLDHLACNIAFLIEMEEYDGLRYDRKEEKLPDISSSSVDK